MSDLVWKRDGQAMTTSKVVADIFSRSHRDVINRIEDIGLDDDFGNVNYHISKYTSPQNKKLKCYNMTKDGFMMLAMGLTGKKARQWKKAYIKAFNKMEEELLKPLTFSEEINAAIVIMDKDTLKAGACGKGLAEWRKIKKQHESKIVELVRKSQLTLNFDKD